MESEGNKKTTETCDCKAPFGGIGQSLITLSGGVLVFASTVCTKCGRVNVDVTQIPFVAPKEEEKQDIILPDPTAKKRLFNEIKNNIRHKK
jgi:hypothetical protein